ncbi:MAG TPA: ComEC/Rec2 family competence protein [Pyrinomonadaceae bacterium]|jgi:competence protein ComEC
MSAITSRNAFQPASQPCASHPLAQLAIAFAAGILFGPYLAASLPILISTSVLAMLLAFVAAVKRRLLPATAFVILAMFLLGSTLAAIDERIPANELRRLLDEKTIKVGEPVELTGVLMREPEVAPQSLYLQLRVERISSREFDRRTEREVSGVVALLAVVPSELFKQEFAELDLRYGARLRVMTQLERADSFRNPGVSPFTEYLDRQGYDATAFVKSPLLIERLENERVFLPLAYVYQWRRRLQTQIDATFSKETAGVIDAAVLGNRYNLSPSTAERFREGGTFHVLVISGLHITFIGGLVLLLARRFTRTAALQFLLSMTVLWAYVLAVGAEASVVRAALTFTIVVLAPVFAREAASLNALGGAALILLAWRPADLFDPSLQLTFISVLAIVIFAWPLLQKMSEVGSWRPTRETPYPPACPPWFRSFAESLFWSERKNKQERERTNYNYVLFKTPLAATLERLHLQRTLRYAFAAIVVSVAVQISLLPFLVIYFHRLSFASLVLNIGVSLLMAAMAIVAGLAMLLTKLSMAVAAPFIGVAEALTWLMVHSVDPFSRAGAASIRLPEYTGAASAVYGFYYLPLLLLAKLLSRWRPLALPGRVKSNRRIWLIASIQLVLFGVIVAHPLSAGRAPGKLRIDFLDVGQGDAALVTFPDNTTLLVDGGGRAGPIQKHSDDDDDGTFERETRSIGETVVSEYLWWRGLDHVDYILATHADADHIDGLNDVARNFRVRAALVARTPANDQEFARFARTVAERNIPLTVVSRGDVLRFGEVTARVLWPIMLANPNASSNNNDSIVLRLQLGTRSLLLTGDVETPAENEMLRAHENVGADVVKVAHHGSRTSSTEAFVSAVRARFAIVSVGQVSIFGHPNAEIVARWKAAGAEVLTTGNSGTITVITDGESLQLDTFVKGK